MDIQYGINLLWNTAEYYGKSHILYMHSDISILLFEILHITM